MLIGNDVVDLRDPESDSRTLRRRFDARVFRSVEREQIVLSLDPERERWSLWAAKEASYKVARKVCPKTGFSPVRFEVRLEAGPAQRAPAAGWPERRGSVRYRDQEFELRLMQTDDYVHAVATHGGTADARPIVEVARLSAVKLESEANLEAAARHPAFLPSRAVRSLVRRSMAGHLKVEVEDLEVGREKRIPLLFAHDRPVAGDLSLSHHGEFVAFAHAAADTSSLTSRARKRVAG